MDKQTTNQPKFNIFTRGQELNDYIILIMKDAPTNFRGTLTNRLMNITMDALEYMYDANTYALTKTSSQYTIEKRFELQHRCLSRLKLVTIYLDSAMKCQCVSKKRGNRAKILACETMNVIAKWMNSDKERLEKYKSEQTN